MSVGQAFTGPLAAGALCRGDLWDVCHSTANAGVARMSGAQLAALVALGQDPAFAASSAGPLRGKPRGLVHLSGATLRGGRMLVGEEPVEPEREYVVAGTDWELEPYGGYVREGWGLDPRYDMPTIVREAVEEHLAAYGPARAAAGRLG